VGLPQPKVVSPQVKSLPEVEKVFLIILDSILMIAISNDFQLPPPSQGQASSEHEDPVHSREMFKINNMLDQWVFLVMRL
jgi:ABC-type transporter lipoprotein component MlaA